MERKIFQPVDLRPRSFLQKLLNQQPPENAIIAVNNLLSTQPIERITRNQILDLEEFYKVKLKEEFLLNLEEFYAVYYHECLRDFKLDDVDLNNLNHLKQILDLDLNTVQNLQEKIGGLNYTKAFQNAIKNGRVSESEKSFLDNLARELQLSAAGKKAIDDKVRSNYIKNHVEKITKRERMSSADEKELYAMAENLGVSLVIDEKNKQLMKKYKLYWELENLELLTIEPDISLQKTEKCFYKSSLADWLEPRVMRGKYGGEYLKVISTGHAYLTNKRLIFTGADKTHTVKYETILNISQTAEGVKLSRSTGKSPILKIKDDVVFTILIKRLLREY